MQHLPGKRILALVVGLAAAAVGSAYAQDTTETGRATIDTTADTTAPGAGAIDTGMVDTSATRDTTDTSGVQNPPGYRGMERDTTIFPPDSGNPPADAGAVEDQATGTYEDSAWQNTGADTISVGDTEPMEADAATPRLDPSESPAGDTSGQTPDSTQ